MNMHRFSKILIGNRGEIASRIIRTTKQMGIKSIAVCNQLDLQSPYVHQVYNIIMCLLCRQMKQSLFQVMRIFLLMLNVLLILQKKMELMYYIVIKMRFRLFILDMDLFQRILCFQNYVMKMELSLLVHLIPQCNY